MTDTQISVGMNVDGVVTGTEKATRKISELGGAAREAGKGTGAIGDGMAGAATKVEAATRNMVGSIQRQIAALEAGDKSSRQYQESLARMRGIDVAALKPYLDQLDQVKAKQAAAAASQAQFADGMGLVKSAAFASGAAMLAAAGGFVAFAKSSIDAADGLNDLSQRVGISVKELGKYQLAAEQSGTSMDAIAKGVKGLSENMLKHGDALRKIGVDSKTADGAMQQLADVFAAMPDGMEKTTLATKMFGKAGMDLIPMLNLGSKGLGEAAEKSAKYAEQMAIAAPMADEFNDRMAEVGMYTKVAGMAMVNDMLPALVDISKAMSEAAQKGGILAGVMAGLDSLGNNLFDWNGNAQRKNIANLTSDLEDLRDKQNAITLDIFGKKGQIQSEIEAKIKALEDAKKAYFGITQGNAGRGNVNPALVKPTVDWMADYKAFMASVGGDGSANKAISELNKELAAQAKILAELSGYTADYEATQQRYAAMLKSGAMSQEAYNRAAQELVAKQPGMLAAAKAQAEALKEIAKLQADYEANLQKSVTAGADELAKAQAAYDAHGKLASVLQEELLARMEITRDQIAGGAGSEAELSAIDAQIKAKRELVKVLRSGEVRDASEKAAKDAADEWKKASEKIEQDITDALMRGFESGKGFAEVLRDTIENTFKTMVIRPVIQASVQGGLNAVGLGGSSSGSLLGSAGNMASIYNAAGATGSVSSLLGSSSMGALDIGGVAVGETAAGAMSAAASAVPYIAASVAAIAIADSLFGSKGGPKSESTYGANFGQLGDTSKTGLAGTYATGVEDAWKTLAKELEITTDLKVGAQTSIDTQGDAQTIFDAYGTVNGQVVSSRSGRLGSAENVGRDEAALQAAMAEEATRLLFAALKASDLPEQYKTYLNTIGDSAAEMTEAMTIVAVVDDFNDALQSLPFENLKTLSFDAAKGLIELSGGLDALKTNLNTYYTNFYTAEEQRAQTIKTINATVGNGFDAASTDAEEFRTIVEAAMLDTSESGLLLTTKLLGVSGAMGALTKESEEAAKASAKLMTDVFDALEKRLTDLVDSIASERESVAGARDSILNGGPKTYAELQAGIAGAKVALPSDERVLAANAAVAVAAANVAAQNNAVNQAKSLTPDAAALNAAKSAMDAAKAATAQAQASADWFRHDQGGRFGRYVDLGMSGWDARGTYGESEELYSVTAGLNLRNAQSAVAPAQSAYDAQLASYNAALESNAAKVAAAQAVLNAATAAQAAAQASAKAAIMDYADAMTQYSGDAEKAVKVLGTLREQTVAYYEAQKELAGLMTTSAASLREAVRATRFGQLDSAASLAQQQAAFAQNYSLALSTTGATKAGYADKLGAALPGLSAALMDASATREDWALASASLLAQSETIAAQLEADAGGMNYEADSLALLDSIDVALGELDSNTAILKSAIEGGTATTAAGLRAIVSQLGGVPAFASGGYHSGGIRVVGENGPEIEVTGPSRIFNASQLVGAAPDNSALISEIRSLREEVVNLRAEARSSAISNSKTARILERVTPDGSSLQTVAA